MLITKEHHFDISVTLLRLQPIFDGIRGRTFMAGAHRFLRVRGIGLTARFNFNLVKSTP